MTDALTLVAVNERAHVALEDRWLDFMEALLQADYSTAAERLEILTTQVEAHAAVEDEVAIPRYSAWLADHQPAEGPADKTDQHLSGDHTILRRALAAAARQLESLQAAGAPLREVASVLEPFVRVQGVLHHHTLREQRFLYPVLDEELAPAAKGALAARLLTSVGLNAHPPS